MKKTSFLSFITIMVGQLFGATPTLTPGVWQEITPPPLKTVIAQNGTDTYDLEYASSNPSILYLNCNGTGSFLPIWKSTDAGSTWANIGSYGGTTSGVGFGRIRVDPKNAQHLYTCSEIGAAEGFWMSTDGGANWNQPSGWTTLCSSITEGNFNDVYDLAVDPSDFNHILTASRSWVSHIAESTDGGTTWKSISVPGANGQDYNILFLSNPSLGIGDRNTWLVTCPEGIWRTSDAGVSWTKNATTYQVMYHTGSYYARTTHDLFLGGTPFPIRSTDNGITWQQLTTGLALFGTYFVITGDGNTLYTGHTNVWTYPNSGPTYVSPESDGMTWTEFKPTGTAQQLPNGPLAMTYDSLNHIMYSSNIDGVWAMKMPSATSSKNGEISRSQCSRESSSGRALAIRGNRIVLSRVVPAAGEPSQSYDLKGQKSNALKVGSPGK